MQRIVVGVDGSPHADRALAWAVREAEKRLAAVDILHCYVVHARGVVMYVPDQERADARLDAIVERNLHMLDRVKWSAGVMGVFNAPSAGLVDAGEGADLIVVGARGAGGFPRLRLGSTGYRTAAHATAPVVVVPDGDRGALAAPTEVTVGVDGSQVARRAARWAVDEATYHDIPLTVVHAHRLPVDAAPPDTSDDREGQAPTRAREQAEEAVRDALDGVDVSAIEVTQTVADSTPAEALLSQTGPDRLLVVGTHGRGALGRMVFGSVSHQCLHHADGPVVVVP
jgi:nucleotide-binding universal stress UspA family protein